MRCAKMFAATFLLLSGGAHGASVAIPAIAYHDIVERRSSDDYAVTLDEFKQQMRYLKTQGYTPVSLKRLEEARRGAAALPEKPVLLTFDDGLASFSSHALPVLREYDYPAIFSIVTAWVDGRTVPENYHGRLLSWEELRAIHDAGNVEIVSHSDDLHRGLPSNPMGNQAPAVIARVYREAGGYESEDKFRDRIRTDLARSVQRMREELKLSPMAIAWPYGKYDAVTVEEAARLGMRYHLTLDEEPTRFGMLPRINRATFHRYRRLADFDAMLSFQKYRTEQLRFVEIALDGFIGRTADEQERRLSALLARLELLHVNAVVMQPFSADFRNAFFVNVAMPVSADVLSRVIQQIWARNRIGHVYLRLPDSVSLAAYRELARLNRFAGAIVTGTDAAKADALATLLRYHNPAVKIGFTAPSAGADFEWIELDAAAEEAAIESKARAALAGGNRVLFALKRAARLPDERLAAAMRALRRGGARHYGFDNDDAAHDAPALRRITPELRAHAIGNEGGR